MRIVFGTDDSSPLCHEIFNFLSEQKYEVRWVAQNEAWPEVGKQVAKMVADGQSDFGIACCFTGTGVSIAANKIKGVRAALCKDAETAKGARKWNDANVLALGLSGLELETAKGIIEAFLSTAPEPEELETIKHVEE
jgi:ribose 5-phosphate isomerase B